MDRRKMDLLDYEERRRILASRHEKLELGLGVDSLRMQVARLWDRRRAGLADHE